MPDTIAAISTPPGEGAIALIRISGSHAVAVAERIFVGTTAPSDFASHTQHLGQIVDGDRIVDQVMLAVHRAPRSYTGEDLVEISCHGGVLVTARVLEACLRAGVRAARPGEFTERAFLNGKLDLTQAEAVIDLIRAQSDLALRSATEQLQGRLGQRLTDLRDTLVGIIAHVDASIDFPDEDIEPDASDQLLTRLDGLSERIHELLETADDGRVLREGVRAVIYGPTNAGKSSLLNRLLGYERAIVSDLPGTTRDTIEEAVNIGGIRVRLIDTAGVRATDDTLEQAGIARTQETLAKADLLLHVQDVSEPRPAEFSEAEMSSVDVLVLNKSDLPEHPDWTGLEAIRTSCVTEGGLDQLREALVQRVGVRKLQPENPIAINVRHSRCLSRALDSLVEARKVLTEEVGLEYVAEYLRSGLAALGELVGEADIEHVLDEVFSEFCIGK